MGDIQSKVVRGQSRMVEGQMLVPVVRRTVGVTRKAVVGSNSVSAQGGGFVCLHPVGVVVEREGEETILPIPDRTRQTLLGMLVAAIVVPLLLSLGVWMGRKKTGGKEK